MFKIREYIDSAKYNYVCNVEVQTDNVCSQEATGVDQLVEVQTENICSQEVVAGIG